MIFVSMRTHAHTHTQKQGILASIWYA